MDDACGRLAAGTLPHLRAGIVLHLRRGLVDKGACLSVCVGVGVRVRVKIILRLGLRLVSVCRTRKGKKGAIPGRMQKHKRKREETCSSRWDGEKAVGLGVMCVCHTPHVSLSNNLHTSDD